MTRFMYKSRKLRNRRGRWTGEPKKRTTRRDDEEGDLNEAPDLDALMCSGWSFQGTTHDTLAIIELWYVLYTRVHTTD